MTKFKYDNESLAELCSEFDLFNYVENHYEGRIQSGKLWLHCPFHTDKTPSLCIDSSSNRFYCFSCKVTGSPIDWFVKMDGMSFSDAVRTVCSYTGYDVERLKTSEVLAFCKNVKKRQEVKGKAEHVILPDGYYESHFKEEIPQEWVDEGISVDAMKKYEIRVDDKSNRIVYPIYDNNGNLISVKGRTRFKCYKEIGIPKYQYYTKIGTNDFFVGMKQAESTILPCGEVIIFEGIKSCLKAYGFGIFNTVAAETSKLNKEQIRILLSMKLDNVVIAFDNDQSIKGIMHNVSLLRKFTNVQIIYDKHHLLDEKMSPIDKGYEIFKQLYEERIWL